MEALELAYETALDQLKDACSRTSAPCGAPQPSNSKPILWENLSR